MAEEPTVEPIAIIGLSCRVPGAGDAGQFWRNLADGVESLTRFTREEQRAFGVSERALDDPNFVSAAMMLDDHQGFDAAFFGMSIREAEVRDPQHRLFLELAHTALEDAGYDPFRYPGEVGVYAGSGSDFYQWINIRSNAQAHANAGWLAVMVGNHVDYCATLSSYKLDLRGPSYTLHTACSTSLVAVHVAAEALRNGECDMALAGSAMLDLPQGQGYVYDEDGIVSPDGHCRAFDAKAAGTIWGSGGGVVVLKRLSEALADGDNIRAVVLGNAINNDGASKVGFSAPSMDGQAAVIAQALGVGGGRHGDRRDRRDPRRDPVGADHAPPGYRPHPAVEHDDRQLRAAAGAVRLRLGLDGRRDAGRLPVHRLGQQPDLLRQQHDPGPVDHPAEPAGPGDRHGLLPRTDPRPARRAGRGSARRGPGPAPGHPRRGGRRRHPADPAAGLLPHPEDRGDPSPVKASADSDGGERSPQVSQTLKSIT
ncbi:hypothetical protein GCM10023075_44930 [Streptosporangium album]